MKNQKKIDKIKKLLRLSRSSNQHEATQALKRAQRLMQELGLDNTSPELGGVNQCDFASSTRSQKPAAYVSALMSIIAQSFGCRVVLSRPLFERRLHVTFIGHEERPTIAKYAYDVLSRQLNAARKDYLATLNKRLKRSTKTARADIFCEAWVSAVIETVKAFALTDTEQTQLTTYMSQHYPNTTKGQARSAKEQYARGGAHHAAMEGHFSGKKATLHSGVNGSETTKLESR